MKIILILSLLSIILIAGCTQKNMSKLIESNIEHFEVRYSYFEDRNNSIPINWTYVCDASKRNVMYGDRGERTNLYEIYIDYDISDFVRCNLSYFNHVDNKTYSRDTLYLDRRKSNMLLLARDFTYKGYVINPYENYQFILCCGISDTGNISYTNEVCKITLIEAKC